MPLVSLALCPMLISFLLRLHSTHIAASAGLGHTISTHQGLLDQSAQVLLLLLMVAGDHHRHGTKTVGLDCSHDTSAAIGHLLSDKTTVQCAKAHAAIFLGNVKVHKTGFVSLLQDWPWVFSGPVIVRGNGDDLVLGELLGEVEELLLLLGDVEVEPHRLGGCGCLRSIGQASSSGLDSLAQQSCHSCGRHDDRDAVEVEEVNDLLSVWLCPAYCPM